MTAGGVEDTALHYKCEISVVVKKTTYGAHQNRFVHASHLCERGPLDIASNSHQRPLHGVSPLRRPLTHRMTARLRPRTLLNPGANRTASTPLRTRHWAPLRRAISI